MTRRRVFIIASECTGIAIIHIDDTSLHDTRSWIATPTRCDNRHNRIAEAKEAGYGGRPERLQGGPRLPAVAHPFSARWQSGNPGGAAENKLHALLADALNGQVFVTVDGERHKITKREAVVHQLVNKSATAAR
jgi:hypothetical protein